METENFFLSEEGAIIVTDDAGKKHKLFQLVAKRDFCANGCHVKECQKLGHVESPKNVKDNAIVHEGSRVFGDAVVCGNALVCGSEVIGDDVFNKLVVKDFAVVINSTVKGAAEVSGKAKIENATIQDNAFVQDAQIFGTNHLIVKNDAKIVGENTTISGNSKISGNAQIHDGARIHESKISENAEIFGRVDKSVVKGNAKVFSSGKVMDFSTVCDNAQIFGHVVRSIVCEDGVVSENEHICPTIIRSARELPTISTRFKGV